MGNIWSLDKRLHIKGYDTSEVHGTGELLTGTNGLVQTTIGSDFEIKVFIKRIDEDKSCFVEYPAESEIVYHRPGGVCRPDEGPIYIYLSKRNGEMYARIKNTPKVKKLRLKKSVQVGVLHMKLVVVFSPQRDPGMVPHHMPVPAQ